MKKLIAVLAAASVASGIDLDGLRVKFGWSDALANIEYFYKIPRTLVEAEMTGWKRTERPEGPLPDLRLYCMPGSKLVCPLYDVGGFVAGLQVSLPKDEYEATHVKPSKKMSRWSTKTSLPDAEAGREYWTLTQYYVSEESLKAGAGPQVESRQTLQDGGVWVMGPDAHLIRIPTTEAELNSTAFKKQNCIPSMGTHYYYNMTPSLRCEDILPWFALVSQGELVGTGFQVFGRLPKQKMRDWFERPVAPRRSAKMTIPNGPACLYDWVSEGVVSMHIYYVDKPWTIRCRDGDSIKPAPAHERLLLSGYRYASKISDEFKKLFSG